MIDVDKSSYGKKGYSGLRKNKRLKSKKEVSLYFKRLAKKRWKAVKDMQCVG